jgi:hypothetical protein
MSNETVMCHSLKFCMCDEDTDKEVKRGLCSASLLYSMLLRGSNMVVFLYINVNNALLNTEVRLKRQSTRFFDSSFCHQSAYPALYRHA